MRNGEEEEEETIKAMWLTRARVFFAPNEFYTTCNGCMCIYLRGLRAFFYGIDFLLNSPDLEGRKEGRNLVVEMRN